MDITITARDCTLSRSIQRRAEAGIRRLGRFEPRVQAASLRFRRERGLHHVEARLTVPGVPLVIARASDADCRTALDRATGRLERQLRSGRTRRREHRAPRLAERFAPAGGG
ncbi:MAG TPA: ribosome-associated translation inhibitor RaiA [Longimicrobiales bacterium]